MKVYSAKACSLSFANIQITGWADGDFIVIDNESDDYGDIQGTDGETTRYELNDDRANITITLMQSSSVNDKLSALRKLDRLAPNGAGIGSFYFKDTQGTSEYKGEAAWIVKPPAVTFGREAKPREWKIRVAKLTRNDGSNLGT
jgi:hypothetical protein